MILRATEEAIQGLLQAKIDDATETAGIVPVLLSDEEENKPPMPYVVVHCSGAEEEITPGCGIFKVATEIRLRSHVKITDTGERQELLDAINQFAYDSPAARLSALPNFHCHGWQPLATSLVAEPETKSYLYSMKFAVHCMAADN